MTGRFAIKAQAHFGMKSSSEKARQCIDLLIIVLLIWDGGWAAKIVRPGGLKSTQISFVRLESP